MPKSRESVLVDTSVFIDFLRGKSSEPFEKLVNENRVALSGLVRLELLQGVKKTELKALHQALQGLENVPETPLLFHVAEEILLKIKGKGLNVGIVDLLLAAEASLNEYAIYSFDHLFYSLAKMDIIRIYEP